MLSETSRQELSDLLRPAAPPVVLQDIYAADHTSELR